MEINNLQVFPHISYWVFRKKMTELRTLREIEKVFNKKLKTKVKKWVDGSAETIQQKQRYISENFFNT